SRGHRLAGVRRDPAQLPGTQAVLAPDRKHPSHDRPVAVGEGRADRCQEQDSHLHPRRLAGPARRAGRALLQRCEPGGRRAAGWPASRSARRADSRRPLRLRPSGRMSACGENLKDIARTLFAQALADCSIERAFERKLRVVTDAEGVWLFVEGGEAIALDRVRRVRVVSVGKAAAAMLNALLSRLPLAPPCELQGVLIAAQRPANLPATIQYYCGGHPVPNEASFAGARAALAMMHALGECTAHSNSSRDVSTQNFTPDETLCIFLLSGGASAMMELPLDAAISLDDTVAFHRALVHSGASIVEMNCVRKHFSAVKGGRLALAAGRAQTLSLLVSDVPPAHLDALGSGPTVGDPTSVAECREIVAKYGLMKQFPASGRRFFASP